MTAIQRVEQIKNLAVLLSEEEQVILLKGLRKRTLVAKAERLNQSIVPNNITMEEIVAEVMQVRYEGK